MAWDSSQRSRKRLQQRRLRIDALEDRTVPALFNVQAPLSFTGMNNNGCVASADFNKDGNMDAVFTNFGTDYASGAGSTITVLYGNGSGGFNRVSLSTGGKNVSFASVGDINGDTFPDLVVSNANQQNAGSVSVFQNDGAGNLSIVGVPFSSFGNNSSWVGLADMTGDNVLDVVVASFGKEAGESISGNNVTIFQGNVDGQGKGNFTYSNSPTTTLAPEVQFIPTALAIADYDGDGINDIAATVPGVPPDFGQPYPNGSLYVFRGTGGAGFAPFQFFETAGVLPVNIQAANLNGDNKADLVIANAGDPNANPEFKDDAVGVLMNVSSNGGINFGIPNSIATNTYGTFAVAVGDYNLDGKADIAAVNYGAQLFGTAAFVSVYTGNGAGVFTPDTPGTYDTQTGFGGGQYLAVGDYDKNGTPDLIVSHATSKVGLLYNTSTPQVVTSTSLTSSVNPSNSGQSTTFTATVSAASAVTGGTVTFFDNGNPIGSPVALVGQQAALPVSNLSVGTHTITATYSGITGFAGSTSNSISQVVNAVVVPQVTINKASGQADPTGGSSILYTVQFDTPVTGFDGSDIVFTNSTVGGTLSAQVTGNSPGQTYTVTITGMTGVGNVVASVAAGGAINGSGTGNAASTSTDNIVAYDGVAPTVTINQASVQTDPTNIPSITFDVKFSKNVTGFTGSDISFEGSTAPGDLVAQVTGSNDTYLVTVTGMTSRGFVVVSIPAGMTNDGVGNLNEASTSNDHSVEFLDNGMIGFKQAVFNATEGELATTATITVSRTGQTDGAVSVQYSMTDGTAHSTGSATGGQNDYTPTSGTLSWADGEGGDKTFTITVLPDSQNEGKELINLVLTNPTGNPGLGMMSAKAAILPSDGQGPGKYFDSDFDAYTIRLASKTGTLNYFRTDPDGNGFGPIELIELSNTMPDPLRPKSALTVTVKKSPTSVDNGTVTIGAITGSGLRSINAKKSNLNLEGVYLNGYLGSLAVGNLVNGADVTTLATTNPKQKTKIIVGSIGDGSTIDITAHVSSLTALSFGEALFRAPSAGVINIKGNMSGDVNITGLGVDPLKRALGTMKVKGIAENANILVSGHVGNVIVGAFRDSRLFAGYTGADDGSGTFTSPAIINMFKATSRDDGFQSSYVVATRVNSALLMSLDSVAAEKFGFYVQASIGNVTVVQPFRFKYGVGQGLDNFEVQVVV